MYIYIKQRDLFIADEHTRTMKWKQSRYLSTDHLDKNVRNRFVGKKRSYRGQEGVKRG